MENLPEDERMVIGVDLNGHVRKGKKGDEEVIGKYGIKERNLEEQKIINFAKRMKLAVTNTFFKRKRSSE